MRTLYREELKALADDFNHNGYCVIHNYLTQAEVLEWKLRMYRFWKNERVSATLMADYLSGHLKDKRLPLHKTPEGHLLRFKINDVYLESSTFRSLALHENICLFSELTLDREPLIINSLHMNTGTENTIHVDTWCMPPPIEDKMIAATLCLDDYQNTNGALFVYPGSHNIPKYRFSDGTLRSIESEKPKFERYALSQLRDRRLTMTAVLGKAGDMLIWHSNLMHGGLPIKTPSETRHAMIIHYWRAGDIKNNQEYPWLQGCEVAHANGYYLKRPHQLPMSPGSNF